MTFPDWLFPKRIIEKDQGNYTQLRADQILRTIDQLERRIGERFPDSGLRKVCQEFRVLAGKSESIVLQLNQPIMPVRIGAIIAAVLLLWVAGMAAKATVEKVSMDMHSISDLLQTTESGINELILLSVALFFLTNIEMRLKRQVALQSLHRLRSIAHVVDMHQLTKDPANLLTHVPPQLRDTESSPERVFTKYELSRYLDYCSELLALISKISALFAQNMDDTVVLSAVNDLESLTQGLSSKIWQKIMILDLAEDK